MIFNMVGGGASLSSTDALLRVQAPAGSTVTITKGSVTKTDLGHENADDNAIYDYYFIIHSSQFDANAWTVTATLGTLTKSATIIIDAADEYDVVLFYTLYLLKDGVGESGYAFSNSITYLNSSYKGNVTSKTGYVELTATNGFTMVWSTDTKADLTIYNTLYARINLVSTVTVSGLNEKLRGASLFPLADAHAQTSTSSALAGYINEYANVTSTGETLLQLDISALSGEYYINLSVGGNSNSNGKVYAYDIYLE